MTDDKMREAFEAWAYGQNWATERKPDGIYARLDVELCWWAWQAAQARPVDAPTDAERLDWIERNLFEHKWGGTLGQPYDWFIRGDFRHTTQRMLGNDFRSAIDAAMRATPADGGEG